jgi:hypothetical protein
VEGDTHGLIWGTILVFSWIDWRNPWQSQDSQWISSHVSSLYLEGMEFISQWGYWLCQLVSLVITGMIPWGDTTLCSMLKVNQCFEGTCGIHLQSQRISQARNQHEAVSKPNVWVYVGKWEGTAGQLDSCHCRVKWSQCKTACQFLFSLL